MTEQTEIRVTFDWQPSEHAEVTQILLQGRLPRPFRLAPSWTKTAVITGWLAVCAYDFASSGAPLFFVSTLPWALFVAFWWWIFTRGTGWGAAKQTAALNSEVHYPITHVFDDEGLRVLAEGANLDLKWSRMTGAREEDGFFMFYWNPHAAYFTPKRGVSIEDQDRLRVLVDRHLGADARLRPLIGPGDSNPPAL